MVAACNASTGTADNATAPEVTVKETTAPISKPATSSKDIIMYKSPGCECCTGWADHMRQAGFSVVEEKRDDMESIKEKYGVTHKLGSCHTAIVDGYVIEGHVPAADVQRLLTERPNVVGLTAPGMPMQSPGMQGAGLKPKGYDVLSFDEHGTSKVFTHY
ncbi:MAG: metal-binding protein [Zetaproteobacteria bacterium CG_4_9_14_3_um_filter_49_83]|nr:MAG: metal-binding protein [Zetaproteobacteria bacterium CG1_02_49_23]PIQ30924.1 MAG: metal-binding protein [Zetaproteobacteria bacterium CG17_big_fil_post_rev_8_21_14_2_50_50_13]PIV29240.1 MAG: metal-binding protein [Zetaproteobacteria bacterium CG02_land_8_20_14_3_00_50_9]PIY56259.1 MAG: metal-binding protein [Zetaproteobacteria bacterium CG_4_10_14_0_8_um_filter_49_80]PJA34741.1 MAG: metal-binding protein [Zetaproteobacteria bacterium CG_4_9_14_3_um_filter_49_83]